MSYSNSESNNQSSDDGNSASNFVLFHDESNSERSSLNSGPLFREDDFTTSKSESNSDAEQVNENPENNIGHHLIKNNKSSMDPNEKSHGND